MGGLPDGHYQPVVEYEQLAAPVLGLPLQRFSSVADPNPNPDPDPLVRGVDPDPDPLVRGVDPDPDPSIIKQK